MLSLNTAARVSVSLCIGIASLAGGAAHAASNLLLGVPHRHEFGAENPNPQQNWFCGQTALKISMLYKFNKDKKLTDINTILDKNAPSFKNPGYCGVPGKKFCARLLDLAWAQLERNGGYATVNAKTTDLVGMGIMSDNSASGYYKKAKAAIDRGNPVIAPSPYRYTVGHFWVIVGYLDADKPGTEDRVILRDVYLPKPKDANYDEIVPISRFHGAIMKAGAKPEMLEVRKKL